MDVKMIDLVNAFRGCVPRKDGHADHDGFLHALRPAEVSAQYGGQHHSREIQEIDSALNVQLSPGLNVFGKTTRRFDVFLLKHILFKKIEDDEEESHNKRPMREQPEGPRKRYAAQETQE